MTGATTPRRSVTDRFWDKVNKTETCWLWIGARDGDGYGVLRVDGRQVRVHRFSWTLVNGPIPVGLTMDHLCRVRLCVNPDHLEPVTHRENTLRGIGISAINARKKLCKNGHPFDEIETNRARSIGFRRRCGTCRDLRLARKAAA